MSIFFWLYSICQRYIIQSNSQHYELAEPEVYVVFNLSKIHNSKQFTTTFHALFKPIMLYSICQRYIIQSNSQLYSVSVIQYSVVFNLSKIHNSKQFTTSFCGRHISCRLYSICQRYIIQSNSQLMERALAILESCIQSVKDT